MKSGLSKKKELSTEAESSLMEIKGSVKDTYLQGWHGSQAGSHGSQPTSPQGLQLAILHAILFRRFRKNPLNGRKGRLPQGLQHESHGSQATSHGEQAGSQGSQQAGSHGSHCGAQGPQPLAAILARRFMKNPPKGRKGRLPQGLQHGSHGSQVASHGEQAGSQGSQTASQAGSQGEQPRMTDRRPNIPAWAVVVTAKMAIAASTDRRT